MGWTVRSMDFENAFPSKKVRIPVYVEMLAHVLSAWEQSKRFFTLRRSLYDLIYASSTWSKLLFRTLS